MSWRFSSVEREMEMEMESNDWDRLGLDIDIDTTLPPYSETNILPHASHPPAYTCNNPRHQNFHASHSITLPPPMGQASSQVVTQQNGVPWTGGWQQQDFTQPSAQHSRLLSMPPAGDSWRRLSGELVDTRLPSMENTTSPTYQAHSSIPLWRRRESYQPGTRSSMERGTIPQNIIDDLLLENEAREASVANHRRRELRANDDTVDLTDDASSPVASASSPRRAPQNRRRPTAASTDSQAARSSRKRKHNEIIDTDADVTEVEHLDLTSDAAAAAASLAQAIASQEAAARVNMTTAPQRIGKRHCIICLEPYTNATTTHCGHIYCHECLTQALAAGAKTSERGIGSCPMCRKPIKRKTNNQIVPIAFMKRSAFRGKVRRIE